MKRLFKNTSIIFFTLTLFISLSAFKKITDKKKEGVFNLLYVDNSKMEGTTGLSPSLLDYLNDQVDTIKTHKFLLYLSNNTNPQFVKSAETVKQLLNKLNESNTSYPNAIEDKKQIWNLLIRSEDLKKYTTINIRLYITENYLRNGLLNENPGFFLKFFPKEIASIADLDESNIHVYINYTPETKSKTVKPLSDEDINKVIAFYNVNNFQSAIHFHINKK